MWCVPTAIAHLTGWNRERVWLDILAQRHKRGRRLTNIPGSIDEPHGGLHAAEGLRVLDRAGVTVEDCWTGTRRLSYAQWREFVRDEYEGGGADHSGRYLVLQHMHLAHWIGWGSPHSVILGLPIAKAWRVSSCP